MYNEDIYSVLAKKSLGQHFLTHDYVPKLLCKEGDLMPEETVVEIGPGTGALTEELLKTGAVVHGIETDQRSYEILEQRFAQEITNQQLHLYLLDIRDGFPENFFSKNTEYKVIANIPYYLSGFLLRTFLERTHQPTQIVFLIQKELAERIAKSPKQSLLSLSVQAFGTPKYIRTISRNHFSPPPRVDSAILSITGIGHHLVSNSMTKHFFLVIRTGFAHKRKQLLNNLSQNWPKDKVERVFSDLNLNLKIRAEAVSLDTWIKITKALTKQNT